MSETDKPTTAVTPRWLAIAGLLIYALAVCAYFWSAADGKGLFGESVWELLDARRLVAWLTGLAVAGLMTVLRFVPLGFLAALTMPRPSTRLRALAQWFLGLAVSFGLAFAVRAVERRGAPGIVYMALPLMGCLLGLWIGGNWARGWRGRLLLIPKLLVLVLVLAVGGGLLYYFALDEAPLPMKPPAVTSAEKRRLVRLIRRSRRTPHGRPDGRRLCLTKRDADLLLSWASSLGSPGRSAVVQLGENRIEGLASARLPLPTARRVLNLRAEAEIQTEQGHPRIAVQSLRIGRLYVPRLVVDLLIDAVADEIRRSPEGEDIFASVESLTVGDDAIEMTYRSGHLGRRVLPGLLEKLGAKPEVVAATGEYVRHLVAAATSLPRGEARFGAFMETAFRLAAVRSEHGDPATENRAAIFALGILLGHSKVERLVGPVTDPELRRAARRAVGRVTLRRRSDWTRHFFVSAAIALASTRAVSDAAGLLKEELDAGGGSGFSFSDLLADRAGTLFALSATRDEPSAIAMQQRLIRGFDVADFCPPAADLPEGISDAKLQSQYGGVGGPGYRKLTQEIDRRLRTCPALR